MDALDICYFTSLFAYREELTVPYEDTNDKVLNTITYTGHEKDYETNLTYMMARYYSQGYGVFISPDKFDLLEKINSLTSQIEDPQKREQLENLLTNPLFWNKYTYCLDNPTNRVDKDGRFSWEVIVVAVTAVTVYIAYKEFIKKADEGKKLTKRQKKILSKESIENQDENGSVGKQQEQLNKDFSKYAGELKNKGIGLMNSIDSATKAPSATEEGEAAAKLANKLKVVKKVWKNIKRFLDKKTKKIKDPVSVESDN